jgi:hypothetical protein
MSLVEVSRSGQATMAVVAAAATPKGSVTNIQYWNPNTSGWQTTPPSLAVGQTTGVAATGNNTGSVKQNMQMFFEITDPSGIKTVIEAKRGIWTNIIAGDYFPDVSPDISLTKVGTWKAEAVLKAEVAA